MPHTPTLTMLVSITNPACSNVAIGLLVMMYPILCKVKYETLHVAFRSKQLWIQIAFSILLNWIIAPFLMVSALSRIGSIFDMCTSC
jgi:ACR3 family arsenite efflux pump ArsB